MVGENGPSSVDGSQDVEAFVGLIDLVCSRKEDTGWTVLRAWPGAASGPAPTRAVVVVGVLPGVEAGSVLRVQGRWDRHPRHGRRFVVADGAWGVGPPGLGDSAKVAVAVEFLDFGIAPGVRPKTAERLASAFGDDLWSVLDDDPGRLREVHGIDRKRAKAVAEGWARGEAARAAMLAATRAGLSPRLVAKAVRRGGADGLANLEVDPAATVAAPRPRGRRSGAGRDRAAEPGLPQPGKEPA